jgi:squalene synthase HpnC
LASTATDNKAALAEAYRHCAQLAGSHYENFPVASLAIPRPLRSAVSAVYAFARSADDLADEGELTPEQRLAGLKTLELGVEQDADQFLGGDPVLLAVADTRRRFDLPAAPFLDLISAFSQDVGQRRYQDFGELMSYCRRSANPVGRILLRLYRADTPYNLGCSDAICSALQLINFLQDLRSDLLERDRVYLPQDEMTRFGVCDEDIAEGRANRATGRLIAFQCERAQRLLKAGSPLGRALPGRAGLELRMIVLGGARVLRAKQVHARNAPFYRPTLSASDRVVMLWGALKVSFGRPPGPAAG